MNYEYYSYVKKPRITSPLLLAMYNMAVYVLTMNNLVKADT